AAYKAQPACRIQWECQCRIIGLIVYKWLIWRNGSTCVNRSIQPVIIVSNNNYIIIFIEGINRILQYLCIEYPTIITGHITGRLGMYVNQPYSLRLTVYIYRKDCHKRQSA